MTELNLPTQLGRFPISGELGRGGMGIVYRGTDPSLGRAVAIKVLPRDAGQDGERLHRFEREARVLASVAHPNIAAIHSLEHADDGALLLVLELVEGESLSERLKRGALPLDEALRTGEAIARAIEAAHGRGVIHRDLKPDNIRITPEGEVKVLDFGLALVEDAGRENATPIDATTAFTVDPRAGDAGMILGTPGYLSPEQARAQSVDRRTDIFSFGCVLFETLTGARAFAGATVIDRISAVLSREPDYAALPTTVPPSVRDMLARCLEKDPERRLPSMRDVRVVLESGASERSGTWVAPVAVVKAPNNLPHRLTSFIGRRREVAEARDLLRGARLLAITGVGGCGKTRLALEVASAFLPEMPGGVWFVELAAVSDPGLVPGAVATALGLRDTAGKSAVDSLREQLAEKASLLVFDNCEHLLGACGELAHELLRACADLKIVATSREPLGMAGETIWRLPSLEAPPAKASEAPEEVARFEAVELFVERARAIVPSFALSAQNAGAVARICRRLDGIPLALELAAARIRVLSPEQIDAKLNDRFRLLTGGGRGALERHQTLRAAIAWSYALLTPEERRCLRALSAFVDGWTLPAAAAVLGQADDEFEVLDLLSHLIDKSLVAMDEGEEPRYHLLESVRQFAVEEAEREGESAEDRRAHAEWFHSLARRVQPELLRANQAAWLLKVDADHENLLAASRWLGQEEETADQALNLAAQLWWYWHQRGLLVWGSAILDEALARPGVRPDGDARAWALIGAGLLAQGRGELRDALSRLEEGLRLGREKNDRRLMAHAMHVLARVTGQMGDYARSQALYDEGMLYASESEDRQLLLNYFNGRGTLAWQLGDQRGAQSFFEQALEVARSVSNVNAIGVLNANLGAMDIQLGELERAQRRLEEALEVQRKLGNRFGVAQALCNLGAVAYLRIDDEACLRHYEESLALCQEMGTNDGAANVRYGLGELAVSRGDGEGGLRYLEASLAHFEAQGDRLNAAGNLGMLALAHLARGDFEAARAQLKRSLALHFELSESPSVAAEMEAVAQVAAARGEFAFAARLWGAIQEYRFAEKSVDTPRSLAVRERTRAACVGAIGEEAVAEADSAGRADGWLNAAHAAQAWLL